MPWVCDTSIENFGAFIKQLKELHEDYNTNTPKAVKLFKNISDVCATLNRFITAEDPRSLETKSTDLSQLFSQLSNALCVQVTGLLLETASRLLEMNADKKVFEKFILKLLYVVDTLRKFTEGVSKVDINLAKLISSQAEQLKRETIHTINHIFEGIKEKVKEQNTIGVEKLSERGVVGESINQCDDLPTCSENKTDLSPLSSLRGLMDIFEKEFMQAMKVLAESEKSVGSKSAQKKLTSTYLEVPIHIEKLKASEKGTVIQKLEAIQKEKEDLENSTKQKRAGLNEQDDVEEVGATSELILEYKTTAPQEKSAQATANPSFFKHAFQHCTKTMSSGMSTITLGAGYLGLTYLSKYYGEMMDQMIHADETGITHQMAIAGTLMLVGVGIVSTGLGRSYSSFPRAAKKSEDRNIEAAPEEKISLIGNEDSSTMPANAPERSRYSSMY